MRVSHFNSSVVWVFSISAMLCGVLHGKSLHAQTDLVERARADYEDGKLDEARGVLDKAVIIPQYAEEPELWLLRGYVYKDLFKEALADSARDPLRDEAIASLFTCITFDKDSTYRENALQAYDHLIRTYWNDAAQAISQSNDQRAWLVFTKYKKATLRVDPEAQLDARDVEFNNALGTLYTKRYREFPNEHKWFDKAVAAYAYSLSIDSLNHGANYNLSVIYYNRGVASLRMMADDTELPTVNELQQETMMYFNKALIYQRKLKK